MFWILCAALVIGVAAALLAPIWRGRGTGGEALPSAAYDLQVYRDQLREVERDQERGIVSAEDAVRLRNEIGRKVLDADRRLAEAAPAARGGTALAAGAVLLVLLAGSLAVYLREGAPGLTDQPMAERLALAKRAYDSRPSQAEAEASAPARVQPPAPDPEYLELIERLRAAVAQKPDDPQGLALLATNEMRLGNMAAARAAQQRLVELRGEDASPQELMQLAALMMEAAGGLITAEAEEVLARALRRDPRQPQSRYLLGMLQLQNGRPDRAFPIWRELLEEGPEDAPWMAPIRASIRDLAWLAGAPDYIPPDPAPERGTPALPGPDQDAVAAAEGLSGAERQQMILGMVEQLQQRLASEGGSAGEWARLISSLGVLGRAEDARAIWTEAQTRFAAQPEALAQIRAAAEAAGLTR